MGYPYQNANYGDYYSTGYPYAAGGIGSFLGGALKKIGGFLPGPLAGIAKGVGGLIGGRGPTGPTKFAPPPQVHVPQMPAPGFVAAGQRLIPGGATGMMPVPYCGGRGYHYNKALAKYERSIAQGREHQDPRSEPRVKSEMVKNRSMNPCNVKALRRAIRREQAFVAVAKRALKGTGITVRRTASFARSRKK